MDDIKNLLFDLGGVIVDIRRQDCIDAFTALGLPEPEKFFGDYAQTGVFMQIEDGSIGIDEFHKTIRDLIPGEVSDESIDAAFQKFIVGIPLHRLKALEELKKGFRLYLLSNTNPIMWNGILAEEFRKDGKTREDYFDGMVTSFEARAAKPDKEIFEYTCRELGIDPEQTLFFDDSQANIDSARQLGFKATLVRPGTEFTDYLH